MKSRLGKTLHHVYLLLHWVISGRGWSNANEGVTKILGARQRSEWIIFEKKVLVVSVDNACEHRSRKSLYSPAKAWNMYLICHKNRARHTRPRGDQHTNLLNSVNNLKYLIPQLHSTQRLTKRVGCCRWFRLTSPRTVYCWTKPVSRH